MVPAGLKRERPGEGERGETGPREEGGGGRNEGMRKRPEEDD